MTTMHTCGQPRVYVDTPAGPVEDVHACPHGEEPCTDCRSCLTVEQRADLALNTARLIARGMLTWDTSSRAFLTGLLRVAADPTVDPQVAFDDLLAATVRVQAQLDGTAERCTLADLDLAESDRDEALWTLLHGSTPHCRMCWASALPVARWGTPQDCSWHGAS